MSLENGTRSFGGDQSPKFLSISANNWGDGGENSSLDDFVRNAEENSENELVERVGVRERVLSKSHEYAGFPRKPQNRNDLAFANLYRRLRLFASVCRFS
jgi:hypothetical protein